MPPSASGEARCVHGEETALLRAGRGGCFMRSSYSRSWRTLAPSPSATFFGEIISKTIFTKNVVVTGSRCLLLCNKVCFNGAHFQMCCLDSRHLPGPLRSRGSSQPPSRARCPHPGGGTFPEHCFPFSFFFFQHSFHHPWQPSWVPHFVFGGGQQEGSPSTDLFSSA